MPKVQFIGRVLPEMVRISIPPQQDIEFKEPDLGIDVTFRLRINLSLVNIECQSADCLAGDTIPLLYIRAFDLARASINMIAFSTGTGLSLILDLCIKEDGIPSPVAAINPDLGKLCTAFQGGISSSIYKMMIFDEPFYRAVNDLITAINTPHVSPQSCGRAMDGLKHLIAAPDAKEPQAWNNCAMRSK